MLLLTKYTVLYKENEICCIILLSLPSRERGLKSIKILSVSQKILSLPSRERGLKSQRDHLYTFYCIVAPFAGAWIEILNSLVKFGSLPVAPFAGAWIEISDIFLILSALVVSLPSRERGLKF